MNTVLLRTAVDQQSTTLKTYHQELELQTLECLQFIDITDWIIALIEQSRIHDGWVNIQSRHTTAAIVINEHEPLLLEDMKRTLEALASQEKDYGHDDFKIRTTNLVPDERENGHSHCKALFLRASETVHVAQAALRLGTWQRIFLVELDGPRPRLVSAMVMGTG